MHAKVVVELEETQHKQEIQLCYSAWDEVATSKFQFDFGYSDCLWEIFSLLHFENFLILYLGCGCIITAFDFTAQMTSSHLLPHADE